MTTIITRSTLESAAYDNIFSYLNDRTIITDPRDKSGYQKRNFVYDSDPLHKSINFSLFPYIVLSQPTIEYSKISANGKVKEITWRMNITVRAAREGASNTTSGTGKVDILSIGDNLQSLFNTDSYKQQLAALHIYFTNLTKTGTDEIVIDQKYLYEANYELLFRERLTVSV